MNFLKYLTYRIGARKVEKVLDYSVSKAASFDFEPQFPSFWRSVFGGLFSSIGILAVYGILSLFSIGSFDWIVPIFLALLISLITILQKHTFGFKEELIQVPDKRYKSGYREEKRVVKDPTNRIRLEPSHRIYNAIYSILVFSSILLIYSFERV